jgi:hypothetical protein
MKRIRKEITESFTIEQLPILHFYREISRCVTLLKSIPYCSPDWNKPPVEIPLVLDKLIRLFKTIQKSPKVAKYIKERDKIIYFDKDQSKQSLLKDRLKVIK